MRFLVTHSFEAPEERIRKIQASALRKIAATGRVEECVPDSVEGLVLLCYQVVTGQGNAIRRYREGEISVVEAKIQTVEDMYRLIWTAIAKKQPISAIYKGLPRLFCPHRLGRNRVGQPRVLCYQYGGQSESGLGPMGSPENWRCVVFEKLRRVELLNGSWKTAPNHSRPATCVVDADIDAEDQPERDPQNGH